MMRVMKGSASREQYEPGKAASDQWTRDWYLHQVPIRGDSVVKLTTCVDVTPGREAPGPSVM